MGVAFGLIDQYDKTKLLIDGSGKFYIYSSESIARRRGENIRHGGIAILEVSLLKRLEE